MKFKIKASIISFLMVLVLGLSVIMPGYLNSKNSLTVREVDVEEIGMLTYEEKAKQLVETFDEYTIVNDDTSVTFEGVTDISNFDFTGVEYLSTNSEETIKKFTTRLDMENETFYIVTQYIQDGVEVHREEIETVPYYDEYEDDYYIEMPDGTSVSVSQSMNNENLEQCSLTLAAIGLTLTAKEAAVLLAAVAVVAAPVITQVVTTVVKTVVTWVRSFWRWFKSLFTKKTTTVVTTTVVTTISYTISIAGTRVETDTYDRNKDYDDDKYYVAIADTDDGLLHISKQPIDEIAALAIITSSTYVRSAHPGSSKSFVVSVYTPKGANALALASAAGTVLGSPGAILHTANRIGYFDHYHPGIEYTSLSHPHVFFGQPR